MKEIKLNKLIELYETNVPLSLSLSPDKNGLKLGDLNKNINKILGCLELTHEVAEYCIKEKVDCLFLHHDPFYMGIDDLCKNNENSINILKLIENNISLYVSHTNLDIVDGGLNDYMIDLLGISKKSIIDQKTGLGRYGILNDCISIDKFLNDYISKIQDLKKVKIVGDLDKKIRYIAVISGKGSSFIKKISYEKKAQLFITGDICYHDALLAKNNNLFLLDIGHDSECIVQEVFNNIFKKIKEENNLKYTILNKKFDFTPWKMVL